MVLAPRARAGVIWPLRWWEEDWSSVPHTLLTFRRPQSVMIVSFPWADMARVSWGRPRAGCHLRAGLWLPGV